MDLEAIKHIAPEIFERYFGHPETTNYRVALLAEPRGMVIYEFPRQGPAQGSFDAADESVPLFGPPWRNVPPSPGTLSLSAA